MNQIKLSKGKFLQLFLVLKLKMTASYCQLDRKVVNTRSCHFGIQGGFMSLSRETFYKYINNGFSVFPVIFSPKEDGSGYNKKPLVSWKRFQTERPSREDVDEWFDKFKTINGIGMATGAVSGVVVVDVDDTKLLDEYDLESTIVVSSPFSKGKHFYYLYEDALRNTALIEGEKLDFRGDGGYVVVPPSHYGDKQYKFDLWKERGFLPSLPEWFKKKLKKQLQHKKEAPVVSGWEGLSQITSDFLSPVGKGGRNNAAAKNAGIILKKMSTDIWEPAGWPLLQTWNKNLENPLPERELRTTWESIINAEITNNPVEEQGRPEDKDWNTYFTANTWTIERINSVEVPDDKYLIDGLIPRGCVFLSGPPKSFKSYISLHLINSLVTQKPLFNKFSVPKKRKVLVMDRENQMWATKDRMKQLKVDIDGGVEYLQILDSFSNDDFRKALLTHLISKKYEVIILDSFRRFYTGNENDSELVSKFFRFVDEMKQNGMSVICIHHFNKNTEAKGSGRLRGSGDIVAYYDANINFEKKGDGGVFNIEMDQTENRMGKEIGLFNVNVIESEDTSLSFNFDTFIDPGLKAEDVACERIIEFLKIQEDWMDRKQISSKLKDIASRNINSVLPRLVSSNKILMQKEGRKFIYKYGTDLFQKGE